MLFLATPDPLGEFVVNLLYALGCLIGTTHFTTSPDPPQSKFAAEVGVLSGVSYEQPIGGKFSLVGKAGVTMLDQGNPWAYSGFQPVAELGLRWYFSGVSPSNANNEGSYLALRSFISYQKMAFWAARPDQYHHVAAFDYSLVWGRTWNLNPRWALKTQIGIGAHGYLRTSAQEAFYDQPENYGTETSGVTCPVDIGLVYRF